MRQPTEWNRLAHEEDVPLLRNDVIFRELAQRGTLDQYLLHDHWHPNERGYQLVTGNVLDFITAMTRSHVFLRQRLAGFRSANVWRRDGLFRAMRMRFVRFARLKAHPQFMAEIDGLDIHFIHVRSKHDNALPLIVTHGWPGSIIEQLKIIDPLANPTAHGASASDAFIPPFVPTHSSEGIAGHSVVDPYSHD